jgi:hypothetical protein
MVAYMASFDTDRAGTQEHKSGYFEKRQMEILEETHIGQEQRDSSTERDMYLAK